MHINVHTHVHNLTATFTAETLRTLLDRLHREEYPDFLVERVHGLLTDALSRAETLPAPDVLLHGWIKDLLADAALQSHLDELTTSERIQFDVLGSDVLDDVGLHAVSRVLSTVRERIVEDGDRDARGKSIVDLLDFLYVFLQPSIRHITHRLMEQQPPGGAVVALTMDITEGGRADEALYRHQLQQTSEQIFAYPGRFFPFVCVNTRRTDHFSIMERALVAQGYVGVKLYPSLGYQVDSQAMHAVYAYCEERRVPLLMHCTPGGFYRSPQTVHFGDPKHWRPILEAFPDLTVCFAHFGGADNLVQNPIPPDSWSQTILDLMDDFDGVYTDVSYNDAHMAGGEKETRYFAHLKRLLDHPVYGPRILFGTDYYLIRMRLQERNFWRYFEQRLTGGEFAQMTQTNPAQFLGIPVGNASLSWALQNYVHFIADNSDRCASRPAEWLQRAITRQFGDAVTFTVSDFGPRWSRNNLAHVWLFLFLRDNQMVPDRRPEFADAGALRLRELQYWTKEHDPPAIFDRKRAALAERIDMLFTASGATYEAGYDRTTARHHLGDAFNDGHNQLVDVAAQCDALYLFPTEADERVPE
jgi:predicted TIM-barrel fold metal-dependent hydrolase